MVCTVSFPDHYSPDMYTGYAWSGGGTSVCRNSYRHGPADFMVEFCIFGCGCTGLASHREVLEQ